MRRAPSLTRSSCGPRGRNQAGTKKGDRRERATVPRDPPVGEAAIQCCTVVADRSPATLSNCVLSLFATSDADDIFQRYDEDLAVSYFLGSRSSDDCVDRGLCELVVHRDLYAYLLETVHLNVNAAIALVVPLLLAATDRVGPDSLWISLL